MNKELKEVRILLLGESKLIILNYEIEMKS